MILGWRRCNVAPLLLLQVLAGDDQVYYCCEKCKENTAATLYMRIHRFPKILQLHIKRFKYAGARGFSHVLMQSDIEQFRARKSRV